MARPLSAKELGALWGEMTKIEVLGKVKISSPFADFAQGIGEKLFCNRGLAKSAGQRVVLVSGQEPSAIETMV